MNYLTRRLRAVFTVFAVATIAVGCQQPATDRIPPSGQGSYGLVFQTNQETAIVRDGAVVSQRPLGLTANRSGPIHLTKDGRFIYSTDTASISVVDTRSTQHRTIACATPCSYFPIGGSLIGRLDAAALSDAAAGTTDYAGISAIDVAAPDPQVVTLGRVQLGSPHPADSRVQPYSYFLDASSGQYLFLDLDGLMTGSPRRWEHPQRLYLAKLNGSTNDLGRYAGFDLEVDVWGAISPDGKHAVVSSDTGLPRESIDCDYAPIDFIDTASGQISRIHPSEPGDGPQSLRVGRAWWGIDGTLYANYQQRPCVKDSTQQPAPPPPSVWAYRNGNWSKLDTHGPAIYALQLPGNRLAVIEPAPNQKPYEMPHGTLSVIEPDGKRKHVADDVTAITQIPADTAP